MKSIDVVLLILVGISIFIIGYYACQRTFTCEKYVQLEDPLSLDDCLNSCTANDQCTSALYDENGTCKVSKNFGEFEEGPMFSQTMNGMIYTKMDKAKGDVYIDPAQREYHIIGSNNIKDIWWAEDTTNDVLPSTNFDQNYQVFLSEREKTNDELGIKEDQQEKFANVTFEHFDNEVQRYNLC